MKISKEDLEQLIDFIKNGENCFIAINKGDEILSYTCGNVYAVIGSTIENDKILQNQIQHAINDIKLIKGKKGIIN